MGWFGSKWWASRWWASWWWGRNALDSVATKIDQEVYRAIDVEVEEICPAVEIEAAEIFPAIEIEVTDQDCDVTANPACAINYQKIQVGNTTRSAATFRDACDNDVLIDPDTVFVEVKDPSGNEGEYQYGINEEVVWDGAGQYHIDIPLTESGYWYFRWYSGGERPASTEKALHVIGAETYQET